MTIARTVSVALGCLALVPLASRPARAQLCAGLPSLSEQPVIVTADLAQSKGAWSVGSGFTAGRSLFAGAYAERTTYRDVSFAATQADTRSIDVGGGVGYEIRVGQAGVCPVATGQWESGPDGMFGGTRLNSDGWTVGAGLSAGGTLVRGGAWRVIPYASATFERVASTVHDVPFAGTDSRAHDTGWVFSFGVGVGFGPRITVAPSLSVPSGIEGGETTFGLSLNVGLGR